MRMVGEDVGIVLVEIGRSIITRSDVPGIRECLVNIKPRSEILLQALVK